MSRRLTLEQTVAKLADEHSIENVKRCVDTLYAYMNPKVTKKPVAKKQTKPVVVQTAS